MQSCPRLRVWTTYPKQMIVILTDHPVGGVTAMACSKEQLQPILPRQGPSISVNEV
jgi:hypothetical protein